MEWPAHLPMVGGGGVTKKVTTLIKLSKDKFKASQT